MKPTIYCFINSPGTSLFPECTAVALADDGTLLASHTGRDAAAARAGIGATRPVTPAGHEHHRAYAERYPDGYRVEWVPEEDFSKHLGVQAAIRRQPDPVPPKDAA